MGTENYDGTEIANAIFFCILSLRQRFGINHIALVLVGSQSQKVLAKNHQQLDSFGKLKDFPFEQLKIWIKELIVQGYLYQTQDEYPVIKLLDKSRLVREGKEQVGLSAPDPNLPNRPFVPKGESLAQTMAAFKAGKTVEEIAVERKLAQTTVLSHLAQAYEDGEQIDINQFVSSEKQETIKEAFRKLGLNFLTPVKQSLGPSYSWEDIKWVKAKLVREQTQAVVAQA